MATVDGVTVAADVHGVVQGDGGAVDKMAGGAGKDTLEGHAAFNQYFGGAGSDTFVVSAKFAGLAHEGASLAFADQYAYMADFQGAGGYSSGDNDFIALSGFGAGSHLDLAHVGTSGTSGATLYYYTITDGVTGDVTNFVINSVNGHGLAAGDYAFY